MRKLNSEAVKFHQRVVFSLNEETLPCITDIINLVINLVIRTTKPVINTLETDQQNPVNQHSKRFETKSDASLTGSHSGDERFAAKGSSLQL